jgi:Na+/H+ antiporter NhaD/arsenite permease-like protein
MLLRAHVVSFPDPHGGWVALAMASTLAGNLTITARSPTSSSSNGRQRKACTSGFASTSGLGLPLTAATLALGSGWLWLSQ